MDTKTCSICKLPKLLSEFYIRRDRNKHISRCKACNANLSKDWRQKMTKEQRQKRNAASSISYLKQAQLGNIKPIIQHKLSSFRGTAKNKNVPFNLDVDYLVDLYHKQKGKCFYTGEQLELSSGLGGTHVSLLNRPNQFSLDRLIPEKGYVKGNVVWCMWLANTCKNMFSEEQFYQFCEKVLEYRKKRLTVI